MICGAVPTTRSVLLKNECSERYVSVDPGRRNENVTAREDDQSSKYGTYVSLSYLLDYTLYICYFLFTHLFKYNNYTIKSLFKIRIRIK